MLKDVTGSKQCNTIDKQLKQVQKMARKLNHHKWADSLAWRSHLNTNESALSSLGRQIQCGFETICLNPALLFVTMEHVAVVMENIHSRIPAVGLTAVCRFAPLLHSYPGLVHYALVDRKNHR